MPVDVRTARSEEIAPFVRAHEREGLKTLYGFSVIWHEQSHAFSAHADGEVCGVALIRIAASLAHVVRVLVEPSSRRQGVGRALLAAAADTGNYYNCHKMSAMVPHNSGAQTFFEACGYKIEAVLPQHEFKGDTAVLRKFLL